MFKKVFISLIILSLFTASAAYAAPAGKIYFNNKEVKLQDAVIFKDNSTYLPMRSLFEFLGANVSWDGAKKQVTAKKGDITVVMTIGSKNIIKNGKNVTLDVSPFISGGKTYVPVRAVAEAFDYNVGWKQTKKAVLINEKNVPFEDAKYAIEHAAKTKDLSAYNVTGLGDGTKPWGKGNDKGNVMRLKINDIYFTDIYSIVGKNLVVDFTIENQSDADLYFSLGGLELGLYYKEGKGPDRTTYSDGKDIKMPHNYDINAYGKDVNGNKITEKFVTDQIIKPHTSLTGKAVYWGIHVDDYDDIKSLSIGYFDAGFNVDGPRGTFGWACIPDIIIYQAPE